jgi:signal transduction histidine kinase
MSAEANDSTSPARAPEGPRRGFSAWLEQFLCVSGEDLETRQRKLQVTFASLLVIPAGLIWGAIYFGCGERAASVFPIAYAVLTLFDFFLLLKLRRFELFRRIQQLLILVLPFALQISLGGFVGSSAVILWSFLSVLLAVLFGGLAEARWWYAAFAVTVVVAALVQPRLSVENRLPPALVLALFVLNVVTVSAVAFWALHSFRADRQRLRELEKAYLNQEMMLRQSEKMATLGTLTAGIAHELNNPAAATRRAAEQLREMSARLEAAGRRLRAVSLTPAAEAALQSLAAQARERAVVPTDLDAVGRSDREAEIEEWLEEHGVENGWEHAPALVGEGLDPSALSRLASLLPGEALPAALDWAANLFPVYALLKEIGEGSSRISEIVGALKSYSYLGQAPVQSVDLREGLDNTLVILRSKLKAGISVHREYAADLPRVPAYGSELNQVWTNLIDNAADAMGGKGRITIRTRRQDGWAVVEIEDDGPGIPEEIRPRIFDPFFTTKAPGAGTGLGLSTSYAIVTRKHRGEFRVESRPGMTRFTVRLPLRGPDSPPSGADSAAAPRA